MMMKKTVLVVGGTGGIGEAIVRLLLQKSVRVCFTYHEAEQKAVKLLEEFGHDNLFGVRMKLEDSDSVESGVRKVLNRYQSLDDVVYSVSAPIELRPVWTLSWQAYQRHMDVNVKGLFSLIKALEEQIKLTRPMQVVVILSDVCIGKPPLGMADYITAKYGMLGLAKSLAVELAKYHCRVNMISPGMTDTSLIRSVPEIIKETVIKNNPLKRLAQPEDVAGTVAYLISEEAGYLNGVNLAVNGGGVIA